jgi:hypothetical protein
MVGGGAYIAGKKVQQGSEREAGQEERLESLEDEQQPASTPAAPQPAAAAPDDTVDQLERLKGLLDQGVLTQDEFAAAKQKVLAG